MDFGETYIQGLVEFYSVEQIRGFWKQALDAMMSRSTENIHISGTSFEGQSGTGVVLSSPAEQSAFCTACAIAIRRLGGDNSVPAASLGTGVDFSQRAVEP